MQKLTDLEYSLVIQALHNAQGQHSENDFIDPYAENEQGYTDEDIAKALSAAENKIQANFLNLYYANYNQRRPSRRDK